MERQATQRDGAIHSSRARRLTIAGSVLWMVMGLAGCAVQPPAVTRLGDGVYRAPTVREAEAYCRNSGDPTRLIKQPGAPADSDGVLFRCD